MASPMQEDGSDWALAGNLVSIEIPATSNSVEGSGKVFIRTLLYDLIRSIPVDVQTP